MTDDGKFKVFFSVIGVVQPWVTLLLSSVSTYRRLSVCVGQDAVDLHFLLVHVVHVYPQVFAHRLGRPVRFGCVVVVICVLLWEETSRRQRGRDEGQRMDRKTNIHEATSCSLSFHWAALSQSQTQSYSLFKCKPRHKQRWCRKSVTRCFSNRLIRWNNNTVHLRLFLYPFIHLSGVN